VELNRALLAPMHSKAAPAPPRAVALDHATLLGQVRAANSSSATCKDWMQDARDAPQQGEVSFRTAASSTRQQHTLARTRPQSAPAERRGAERSKGLKQDLHSARLALRRADCLDSFSTDTAV
jgi:hypothetical protein